MFASSGRDYHFYITDASGDGRAVEYDCNSKDRKLVVTKTEALTNFFIFYKDKVKPSQKNGIYGHGRERYDSVMQILGENKGNYTNDIAWEALKATAQDPNPNDVTSNTQWSIVYNDTDLSAEIAIRRNWNNITNYKLIENQVEINKEK